MMLSRRSFLKFLGAAPVAVELGIMEAFNPHRVFFDMGHAKIWTPEPLQIETLDALSQKLLTDIAFRTSPVFTYLTRCVAPQVELLDA